MRKYLIAAPALLLAATPALAQNGVDYSGLTGAVDFDSAITALVAIAGVVALILVARKGVRFVLGMIR